jgi:2-dehydro-3-deoxyphosphogluconate aldolase/(4S)-4-hydroxy-2-oxoglutarate aldolase
MEITLRTPQGLACHRGRGPQPCPPCAWAQAPSPAQPKCSRCVDAGAHLCLVARLHPRTWWPPWRAARLPFVPGVMTPSEVMAARDHGFHADEAVPRRTGRWPGHAASPGRAAGRCAVSAPPAASAWPISASFWHLPNVAMVGGSWLTPADALAAGDWARITRLAAEPPSRPPASEPHSARRIQPTQAADKMAPTRGSCR